MWTIIKFNPKKLQLMKKEISSKLENETIYYGPKILIQYYSKNKLQSKEFKLLGDYIFCYNKNFLKKNSYEKIKFSRGLKYILSGCFLFQNDIRRFIKLCKNHENKSGYVETDFLNLSQNKKYKFLSGPFTNKIFEVIGIQKNKIDVLIGKFKTSLIKKDFLYRPI